MADKTKTTLVCKHCGRSAERAILMGMAQVCGASVYPPPEYCYQSPTEEHEYVSKKLEAVDG